MKIQDKQIFIIVAAFITVLFMNVGEAHAWNAKKEKACKEQVAQAEQLEKQFNEALDKLLENPDDYDAVKASTKAEQGLDELVKNIDGYKREIAEARRKSWSKAVRKYRQYAKKIDEISGRVKGSALHLNTTNTDLAERLINGLKARLERYNAWFEVAAKDLTLDPQELDTARNTLLSLHDDAASVAEYCRAATEKTNDPYAQNEYRNYALDAEEMMETAAKEEEATNVYNHHERTLQMEDRDQSIVVD